MRVKLVVLLVVLACSLATLGQTALKATRDSSADAVFVSAIMRMGAVPSDSVATGTSQIVTGSRTQSVPVRIISKEMHASLEQFDSPDLGRALAISREIGRERIGNQTADVSYETCLTAESVLFPLPWMSKAYASPDTRLEYLGKTKVNNIAAVEIRVTNTFASDPSSTRYASWTTRDVWLDAVSGLPIRIAYERRDAGGAAAAIAMAVEYSDYRAVQGVLYPFRIRQYVNGTLWADISIQSVSVNTGISDAEFALN